jgi:single-strand DNA-binding protein
VLVQGRLRLSKWETPEGEKRSTYGLEVDEVAPSLRFATATVQRMTRFSGREAPPMAVAPDDPWMSAAPPNGLAAA